MNAVPQLRREAQKHRRAASEVAGNMALINSSSESVRGKRCKREASIFSEARQTRTSWSDNDNYAAGVGSNH
jgi:hypothetical protein